MKPRTKFEHIALKHSAHLPPISQAQLQWAFKNLFNHFAYRLPSGKATCMDCGHQWTIGHHATHCTCPHCKAKLKVQDTLKRKYCEEAYFTVLTTHAGHQVLRLLQIDVQMKKKEKAQTSLYEIGSYWWNKEGQLALVAVPRSSSYFKLFNYSQPLAIRKNGLTYQQVSNCPLYPRFKVTKALQRNGFNKNILTLSSQQLISALLTNAHMETIVKTGNIDHIKYFLQHPQALNGYWHAYKIAIRNNYDIPDISIWVDYLNILKTLGKDTHNAKYVCPSNLHRQHNIFLQRLRKKRNEEKRKKQINKIVAQEEMFKTMKKDFFGISFTDGTILVRVLESVQEHFEEGLAMHHCVFENEYHLKDNTLILSATIDGRRVATIELSLSTFEVIQCRGNYNKEPEYHNEIIKLINENKHLIQQKTKAA